MPNFHFKCLFKEVSLYQKISKYIIHPWPSPNFHLVPRIWIKFLIFYVNMVGEWKWTSYHVRSWQILNFWNITNTFLHNKIPCLLCPKYAEVNTFVNHFSPEMINNCNKINLTIIWQGSWGGRICNRPYIVIHNHSY